MIVCRCNEFLRVFAAESGKQFAVFAVSLPVYGKLFAANVPYACGLAALYIRPQAANRGVFGI